MSNIGPIPVQTPPPGGGALLFRWVPIPAADIGRFPAP